LVCESCRAANKANAKFCKECGATLTLACPVCGTAHESG